MKSNLSIVGSGLTGPLLSTILAKQCNLKIDMFERFPDSRVLNNFSGRSINLALSKRGINALKYAGVYNNDFESLLIPMYGRTSILMVSYFHENKIHVGYVRFWGHLLTLQQFFLLYRSHDYEYGQYHIFLL